MKHAPHPGESSPAHAPIRTAGITPSTSIRRAAGADADTDEEAR
jgi:hypothetical protein